MADLPPLAEDPDTGRRHAPQQPAGPAGTAAPVVVADGEVELVADLADPAVAVELWLDDPALDAMMSAAHLATLRRLSVLSGVAPMPLQGIWAAEAAQLLHRLDPAFATHERARSLADASALAVVQLAERTIPLGPGAAPRVRALAGALAPLVSDAQLAAELAGLARRPDELTLSAADVDRRFAELLGGSLRLPGRAELTATALRAEPWALVEGSVWLGASVAELGLDPSRPAAVALEPATGRLVVRLERAAGGRPGWLVVTDAGGALLALAPLTTEANGSIELGVLVGRGRSLADVVIDVVTDPTTAAGRSPARRLLDEALVTGAAATAAERLGQHELAASRWLATGRRWALLGDHDREVLAVHAGADALRRAGLPGDADAVRSAVADAPISWAAVRLARQPAAPFLAELVSAAG